MDVDTTDLDAQIAALQAEKQRKLALAQKQQERQAREDAKVLIASTPGKKEKAYDSPIPLPPRQPVFTTTSTGTSTRTDATTRPKAPVQTLPTLPIAGPSRMSNSLAALRRSQPYGSGSQPSLQSQPTAGHGWRHLAASSKPMPIVSRRSIQNQSEDSGRPRDSTSRPRAASADEVDPKSGVQRDEDSLVIEKLRPGPREFGLDPEGEEAWEFVEPNSGIRLSKRVLPHSTLQSHLYGRYFLPPSLLYSIIRLSRDGATYDIPVDGDWVTIAVVAERGEVRVSGTQLGGGEGDGDNGPGGSSEEEDEGKVLQKGDFSLASPVKKKKKTFQQNGKGKGAAADEEDERRKRRRPRKYINLRLAALPSRSKLLSDPSTGPSGDALLQLLLFEADSIIRSVPDPDNEGEMKRTYKGGSGGAYERWCNLNVGDVVGVISPRVLRPLRAGKDAPHPLTLPLALNPSTGDSVFLIGQSRDLGCCSAIQKDGNRCKTWVDLRQSQVCEYHVHLSVQRSRSGRAEFTASTSSYHLSTNPTALPNGNGKNATINHRTKTGLLPGPGAQTAPRGIENGGGGATYVVGGNTIRTGSEGGGGGGKRLGFGPEMISEKLGRGRAEKRKRMMEAKEAEEMLEKLVTHGQGSAGAKYLKAIEARRGEDGRQKHMKKRDQEEEEEEKKRPFNAESIKKIGFDPSAIARLAGMGGGKDEKKRKEETIALLKIPGEGFRFDPRKKIKVVNVRAPERRLRDVKRKAVEEEKQEKDERQEETSDLEIGGGGESEGEGMIDLD